MALSEFGEQFSPLVRRISKSKFLPCSLVKSAPPQFALRFDVDMPTPGWTLETDSVTRPDADGRVVVLATGTGPDGMVTQVITRTALQAQLGSLDAGTYTVEVRIRRGDGAYRTEGCFLLEAAARAK